MTRHDPIASMGDMLDYAEKAVRFVEGKSRSDLDADEMLMLALVRAVEVVGEAANRVPQGIQLEYPQIPWSQIIGTRHRLIHGYDILAPDILWDTIKDDLPPLIEALREQGCRAWRSSYPSCSVGK